jgi:hypothetical protein
MLIPGEGEVLAAADGARVAEEALSARVFWSGGSVARSAAEKFASESGGVTLEMTPADRAVEVATRNLEWAAARPIWQQASAEFAGGC